MRDETLLVETPDGYAVHTFLWTPDAGEPRAVLQVIHGMSEHAARYARLARFLTDHGWAVIAHDQRGHGQTAHRTSDLGYLADEDGWPRVVADARAVTHSARERFPDRPLVVFGHSMGSYVLQSYLFEHDDLAGAVFCGSTLNRGPLVALGRRLARFERWRKGPRKASWLLQQLSFGQFARSVKGRRTAYDWLSRDPAEVDAYIADPLCGFPATTGLWVDLLDAFGELEKPENVEKVRADLPLRIMSGAEDPVHEGGRGFRALEDLWRGRGFQDLTAVLYPGARHEILNETNRDEVMEDLRGWLEGVVA
jgi:alpha-beta hydrolase superfamily lysophospholipase